MILTRVNHCIIADKSLGKLFAFNMAFFGLTALGAQSPFASEYKTGITVAIFELSEFSDAYDDVLEKRKAESHESSLVRGETASGVGRAIAGGAGSGSDSSSAELLSLNDLPAVLAVVFHGPAPESELKRATALFSSGGSRDGTMRLPKDLFLAGIEELQSRAEPEAISPTRSAAAHYVSFDELRQHRKKGVPTATGPADNFSTPLTLSQEIGWRGFEMPADKRHPKKHCEETKFMALLRSSGFI